MGDLALSDEWMWYVMQKWCGELEDRMEKKLGLVCKIKTIVRKNKSTYGLEDETMPVKLSIGFTDLILIKVV